MIRRRTTTTIIIIVIIIIINDLRCIIRDRFLYDENMDMFKT